MAHERQYLDISKFGFFKRAKLRFLKRAMLGFFNWARLSLNSCGNLSCGESCRFRVQDQLDNRKVDLSSHLAETNGIASRRPLNVVHRSISKVVVAQLLGDVYGMSADDR